MGLYGGSGGLAGDGVGRGLGCDSGFRLLMPSPGDQLKGGRLG